jgi:hypothetical protein
MNVNYTLIYNKPNDLQYSYDAVDTATVTTLCLIIAIFIIILFALCMQGIICRKLLIFINGINLQLQI